MPVLCNWITDFLTGRPQSVHLGKKYSSTLIMNTGTPQGCVLSPILFILFTHDWIAIQPENIITKFPDGTTVNGLIIGEDDAVYMKVVSDLVTCTIFPTGQFQGQFGTGAES